MIKLVNGKFKKWEFPGGEVGVRLIHVDHGDSAVRINAAFKSAKDFMTLVMLVDALKREPNTYDKPIYLTIGYFPYGRQDKMQRGESLSVSAFAKLIDNLGLDRIDIIDPHSPVTIAAFHKTKVFEKPGIISQIMLHSDSIYLFPDEGAYKRYSKHVGAEYMFYASKVRDQMTGDITGLKINDVENFAAACNNVRNIRVVDDICDGGRTFTELGKAVRAIPEAAEIPMTLYVTHGIFSKGTEELAKYYDSIYSSNTFQCHQTEAVDGVGYYPMI
jgi:ribose-phosphate pyrophosphokinase